MMDKNQKMPVALSTRHGFVDGEHISDLYKKIQETLDCTDSM
ncbi:hypothetical protein [Palleniella muris]|nr:hypothetical protein [Palleniella muris]